MRTAKKVPKPQAFVAEKTVENNDPNNEQEVDEDQQIIEAFKTFDLDGDGRISVREFVSMMHTCAPDLTPEDINEIVKESDLDHKGSMDYYEFIEFWKSMSQ